MRLSAVGGVRPAGVHEDVIISIEHAMSISISKTLCKLMHVDTFNTL